MLKPAEKESCSLKLQAARVHDELLVLHADSELIFWSVSTRQVAGNIVLWPTSTRCSGCPWHTAISGQVATRHIIKPSPSSVKRQEQKVSGGRSLAVPLHSLFQRFLCRMLDRPGVGPVSTFAARQTPETTKLKGWTAGDQPSI